MIKTFFLLVLFLTSNGIFAQHVDRVNAPLNPVAFKYKKEHFNFKGEVYSIGSSVFSKEGYLTYENNVASKHFIYKNGKLHSDTEGQIYDFDDRGYLIKHTYANLGVQTQTYNYNAKDLLTNVNNLAWLHGYPHRKSPEEWHR